MATARDNMPAMAVRRRVASAESAHRSSRSATRAARRSVSARRCSTPNGWNTQYGVAATVAAYVNYVTPVEGVQEVLAKTEPEVAENHLIFPPASFTKNCSPTPTLEGQEEKNVIKAFDEVLNG